MGCAESNSLIVTPLNILCVIDHLGPGGAQRQMATLAPALKQRGHSVQLFLYYPEQNFFRPQIDACGIVVHAHRKGGHYSFGVLKALASLIERCKFDIVLSYLDTPNVYTELTRLLVRGPKLVVSERSSYQADRSPFGAVLRRLLHVLSDHVVANSQTQTDWLRRKRWLAGKVSCIYNGLDLSSFSSEIVVPATPGDLRLLAIGRIGPEKNILNLIHALHLLYDTKGVAPEIGWVGRQDSSPAGLAYRHDVDMLLCERPEVAARWHWLGEESDVPRMLGGYHALIHPSLYEGLPNVVCEALAAGKPVLVSGVCDHPFLIADGRRGFLFDPTKPSSIAQAMESLSALSAECWRSMSRNAREFAEQTLGVERMVASYEDLFRTLIK